MSDHPPTGAPAGMPARRYRPELHGLRGVAIALVVLFHVFGDGRVSGGIDVFLAISGLLFTLSLLRRAEGAEGAGWLLTYLGNLARRLLPPAVVVLAAVCVATVTVGLDGARLSIVREVRASLLFYENWELIASQLSYAAAGPTSSPLQHFWSLSVQGQFFAAWPVVALLAVGLAPLLGVSSRTSMSVLVGAIAVGSFLWALRLHQDDQAVAYLHTGTRVWELAVGGLAGLLLVDRAMPTVLRIAIGWLGLALVVSSGFVLDGARLFPGPAAWWPLGGLLLVVVAGSTGSRWGADWVLQLAPLRWLGDVAYPLYLWHWPLLVFTLQATGRERLPLAGSTALVGVSLLLAWATHRAVERPFTRPTLRRPLRSVLVAGSVVALGTTSLQAWAGALSAERDELLASASVASAEYPGAAALGPSPAPVPEGVTPVPDLSVIRDDLPEVYDQGCVQSQRDTPESAQFTICGEPSDLTQRTILVTGGSHATMWQPALQTIARQQDWTILVAEKSGCLLTANRGQYPESEEGLPQERCIEWNANAVQVIEELQPDAVFTIGTTTRGDVEVLPRGFLEVWESLAGLDVPVIAVRDLARMPQNVADCLEREGLDAQASRSCGQPRGRVLEPRDPLEASDGIPENVTTVDLTDSICPDDYCPAIIGNVVVLRDHSHLTTAYARSLAPVLDQQLREQAPWLYR